MYALTIGYPLGTTVPARIVREPLQPRDARSPPVHLRARAGGIIEIDEYVHDELMPEGIRR
jgi:hypothetical protein